MTTATAWRNPHLGQLRYAGNAIKRAWVLCKRDIADRGVPRQHHNDALTRAWALMQDARTMAKEARATHEVHRGRLVRGFYVRCSCGECYTRRPYDY